MLDVSKTREVRRGVSRVGAQIVKIDKIAPLGKAALNFNAFFIFGNLN
jgi:hypothetical protein